MSTCTRVTLALLLVLLALPGAASAAPSWLPAAPSFPDADSMEVGAAMAPDGTLVLTRLRADGATGTLEARVRPPGGEMGPPQTVDQGPVASFGAHTVVAGPDGTFAVVYADVSGGPDDAEIRASLRPPGGGFGPPRFFRDAVGATPSSATVALDADRNVYLAGMGIVTAAPLETRAGVTVLPPHEDPRDLWLPSRPGTGVGIVGLHVSPGGGVRLAYWRGEQPQPQTCGLVTEVLVADGTKAGMAAPVAAVSKALTGTYDEGTDECVDVSGAQIPALGARMGVAPGGATTVAYVVTVPNPDVPGTGMTGAEAVHAPAGGTWGPSEQIMPLRSGPVLLELAMAGATPTAAVTAGAHPSSQLLRTVRNGDGTWQRPEDVTGPPTGSLAGMVGQPDGSALLLILDLADDDGPARLVARRVGPNGGAEPIAVLDERIPTTGVRTAFATASDGAGNAVAAFLTTAGADDPRARYAGFDGAGPPLRDVRVPPAGRIGERLAFSATLLVDVWSGVASGPSWAFGDGGGAAGAAVTHAYGGPGTFTATVSATDGVGNTSTAGGQVQVQEIPAPPAATDTTAPRFTGRPRVTPRRVRSGQRATVRFTLSEAARVTATLARKARGIRRGRRCVAPPRRRTARGRRCTRWVTVRTLRGTFAAGPGRLTLRPRPRLAPGRYRLTLTATDNAGNASTTTVALTVRPARKPSRRRG